MSLLGMAGYLLGGLESYVYNRLRNNRLGIQMGGHYNPSRIQSVIVVIVT